MLKFIMTLVAMCSCEERVGQFDIECECMLGDEVLLSLDGTHKDRWHWQK